MGSRTSRALLSSKMQFKRLGILQLFMLLLTFVGLYFLVCEGVAARHQRLIQELKRDQKKLAEELKALHVPTEKTENLRGPGIVICAGGNQLLINTYVSVKVLRTTLKSNLPIEIYHAGPEDVGPLTLQIFEEFSDVKFVDLKQAPLARLHRNPRVWKTYMWKIYSLYLTSFSQVLLLDADSQPLRDPADLFQSAAFLEKGNLFWSDFWGAHTSEAPEEVVYQWLGLKAPWQTNANWQCGESGQVLFDKSRHGDVLEWLWFLNSHAELLYEHMLGDKDTFEMAFMLANKQDMYHRLKLSPGIPLSGPRFPVYHQNLRARLLFKHEQTRYLRLGMLQYGPDSLPSFMHRTERTKFANFKNGYDLETMKPEYFLPSFGPNVSVWEKQLIWNAHSFPNGMVDFGGEHCKLNFQQREILEALGEDVSKTAHVEENCWYPEGKVSRQPIFRSKLLGNDVQSAIFSSIAAYRDLESILGEKVRWRTSP